MKMIETLYLKCNFRSVERLIKTRNQNLKGEDL